MNKKQSIRTDLALEAAQLYREKTGADSDGIEIKTSNENGFEVNIMHIKTDSGAEKIGKQKGKYVTIYMPDGFYHMPEKDEQLIDIIYKKLLYLTGSLKGKTILAAGLGNRHITADCIGPKVIERLLVTRHLHEYMPKKLTCDMGNVCAISPGVLGITGIETGEILVGVCARVHPDIVVLIDALAAKSVNRLASTIQMCDSSISPGSGVGNNRKALDKELLGADVYVIGVPTVVDAYTMLCNAFGKTAGELEDMGISNMTVTPKDIDVQAKRTAAVIAAALNKAFNENLTDEQINYLTNY